MDLTVARGSRIGEISNLALLLSDFWCKCEPKRLLHHAGRPPAPRIKDSVSMPAPSRSEKANGRNRIAIVRNCWFARCK